MSRSWSSRDPREEPMRVEDETLQTGSVAQPLVLSSL